MANFTDLPAELRVLVFKECIKERCITPMYLNKFLYNELKPELYDWNDFQITIDPSIAERGVGLFGGTKHFLPVSSEHLHQPSCLIGKKVPFEKFRSINIQILPPDPKDPGQIIRARLQITRMLKWLLPRSTTASPALEESWARPAINNTGLHLPPVQISLIEHEDRRWGTSSSEGQVLFHSDIVALLSAFRSMRYAQALKIQAPEAWKTDDFWHVYEEVELCATIQMPFGSNLRDTALQSSEDSWHIVLNSMLDDLPGPAAAALRLERFATWCDHYEEAHRRRIHGWRYVNRLGQSIQFGGSIGTRNGRSRGTELRCRKTDFTMWALAMNDNGQRVQRNHWKAAYPQGIPRRSSQEYALTQQSASGFIADLTNTVVEAVGFRPLSFRCPSCANTGSNAGPA